MNAARASLSRKSVCATCLSQDRKLFPVNDSKSQPSFLNLSETDKLCWECNRFVLKMVAFRRQAARAQALLANTLHGDPKVIKISSLSRLACTPVYLDISITPDPLQIDMIKTESVKEEHENASGECPIEDAGSSRDDHDSEQMTDVTLQVLNKQSEAKSDETFFGEAMDDDSLFTVSSKEKLKGVDGSCGVAKDDDTGDIANASLKSLLSRKSTLINIPPFAKKFKDDSIINDNELEGEEKITQEKEVVELKADKRPIDSDPMFTETIMSEEEMLLWRERKKKVIYYAINNPALRCEQCIEPFKNKILFTAHMRRHEEDYGTFACTICGLRSLSSRALRAHTTQHHRLLTCKLCGHEWDSRNGMRQHGSVAHGVPIAVWDCDQCDRNYATQEQLKRHLVAHRVAACRVCGARVGTKIMQQHMQSHLGLLTCAVRARQCSGARSLSIHMRTHSTKVDEAAFCAECNLQFRTMQLYRSHLRYTLKHARTDDMPFKCGECGKAFLLRSGLTSHIDGVHGADEKYSCEDCGQMFKTRKNKNYHVRRVHKGVRTRNYICDHCGRAFTTKSSLMNHINTHTGARPYKCSVCDATFGHSSALYLHCRYKHKIKKKKDAKKTEEQ